jgi:hypothetical protein
MPVTFSTPSAMFEALSADNLTPYLEGAGARVQSQAEADWPSEEHPENIWARDRSVNQFSREVDASSVTVTNGADYGVYANEGYTRRGQRTARPYFERGGEDYLDQTAGKVLETEPALLLDHLTGGG